jgi:hypothetical protein
MASPPDDYELKVERVLKAPSPDSITWHIKEGAVIEIRQFRDRALQGSIIALLSVGGHVPPAKCLADTPDNRKLIRRTLEKGAQR